VYFGTIFNEIFIDRVDASNTVIQTIRVPITYGPKDKVLSRVEADPDLSRPFASVLPYISFENTGMRFDEERHLNNLNYQVGHNTTNKNLAPFVYNPASYDLDFEMNVMVKNLEDGTRIIEQILPFFQPDWTSTLRLIDVPDVRRDIPVVLTGIKTTDTWTGDYNKRRVITYTFTFTMRAYFFGPVSTNRIIKKANINFGTVEADNVNSAVIYDTVMVTPGLTIDGKPTTNPNLSVPYSEIDWSADYDFIIQKEISNPYAV
jgi:hypothetical protein